MIVKLELSPEEVAILTPYATVGGMDVEAFLHSLIALLGEHGPSAVGPSAAETPGPASTPPVLRKGTPGIDDSEERAERTREAQEMQNNIRRWREEQRRGTE